VTEETTNTENENTPDNVEVPGTKGKTLLDTIVELSNDMQRITQSMNMIHQMTSDSSMSASVIVQILEDKGIMNTDDWKKASETVVNRVQMLNDLKNSDLSREEMLVKIEEAGHDKRWVDLICPAESGEVAEETDPGLEIVGKEAK